MTRGTRPAKSSSTKFSCPAWISLCANGQRQSPIDIQGGLAVASGWADRWVVDLILVRFTSFLAWGSGYVLRFLQFGNLQAYAFFFGAGVIGLIYFLIAR